MSLFEPESVDFFSRRITGKEAKQLSEWANAELQSRIDTAKEESRHLLHMVAHQVVQALDYILVRPQDKAKFYDQPLFAQYYTLLLQSHASTEQPAEERETVERKMQQKIEQREAARDIFLQKTFATDKVRFLQIADWQERNKQPASLLDFDIIVETFVDHLTQQMLQKSLEHVIFPKINVY